MPKIKIHKCLDCYNLVKVATAKRCRKCANGLIARTRNKVEPRGKERVNFKGVIMDNGYVMVYLPEHPKARRNYVARAVIKMEKKIQRYLLPSEMVHHKNENRQDDRLVNLELMTKTAHRSYHMKKQNLKRWK